MGGEWRETTIGELLARDGGSVKTGPFGTTLKAKEYSKEGVPLISVGEVGYGSLRVHEKTPRAPQEVVDRLPEYLLEAGDIVFGRKGAVDRSALVKHEQAGWFLGSDGIRLRVPSTCDARFVAYQLQSSDARSWLVQHATGTTMASLNQAIIERVPIVLPPLPEQRAIAHILGTLDDKIDLSRWMNETLEATARTIFKSWFVDFNPVRARAEGCDPGLPKRIADLFPDRFENSELGEIPAGWTVSSLRALFPEDTDCVLTGPFGSNLHAHDYRDDGVPLILVKHVINGHIIEDNLPHVGIHKQDDLQRYRLRVGDIVFTRVGAVGRSAYVHPHHSGWLISGQMLRVRIPDWTALHPRYLAQVFLEKSFTEMVEGHALGTTRPSLNTSLLRAFRFLVPSKDVMTLFARKVSETDLRVQANRGQSRTLFALRDTLLPKLMSGELRLTGANLLAESLQQIEPESARNDA